MQITIMAHRPGFVEFPRVSRQLRPLSERIKDNRELYISYTDQEAVEQASRCMDCGVPFCHAACPVESDIAEWISKLEKKWYKEAFESMQSEINFPEFTSRLCEARCESACVLSINQLPVSIPDLEDYLINMAFKNGWVSAYLPKTRTNKKIAVIGSGPAGLTVADELNKKGHFVDVFESADRPGGILRYGIPDCRLEKSILDRRLSLLCESGIRFICNASVGENIETEEVLRSYDAICICIGPRVPRDLPIKGRNLNGIYFVMELLEYCNRVVAGDEIPSSKEIFIKDKNVVVLSSHPDGWIGVLNRQNPKSVLVFDIFPGTSELSFWPLQPKVSRASPFEDDGYQRLWGVASKEFIGDENGKLVGIKVVDLEWKLGNDNTSYFFEIEGSERITPCEIAIISSGFMHPKHLGLLTDLDLGTDERGNILTTNYQTALPKVFAAGDARTGQSQVVRAMQEGKSAASRIDAYLLRQN